MLKPVQFFIGGNVYTGTFSEEQEPTYALGRESVADNDWSCLDGAGHFHAFDTKTGDLPTLRMSSRHVPCDGACGTPDGCGGYPEPHWFCLICEEEVTPQYHQVERQVVVAVEQWWEATIHGPMLPSSLSKVSVVIKHDGSPDRFGIATVQEMTYESGQPATMELVGLGALGWRPLEQKGKTGWPTTP